MMPGGGPLVRRLIEGLGPKPQSVESPHLESRILNFLTDTTHKHVCVERRDGKAYAVVVGRSKVPEIETSLRAAGMVDDLDSIIQRLVDANPSISFIDLIGLQARPDNERSDSQQGPTQTT